MAPARSHVLDGSPRRLGKVSVLEADVMLDLETMRQALDHLQGSQQGKQSLDSLGMVLEGIADLCGTRDARALQIVMELSGRMPLRVALDLIRARLKA